MPEVAGMKIDRTINYGHILQALTLMIGLGGTAVFTVQTNTATRLTVAAMQVDINRISPIVSALEASQALNAERLTNHANSLRSQREDFVTVTNDLRKVDGVLQSDINLVRVDVAGLKGREK